MEEGADSSGGLQGCDVCRWKIKRAKAQLEFNLATAVKENKKNIFTNT